MQQKKTGWLQSWFGVQDMTVGRPMDSLVRFSIPLLMGNLAQQLYNTVDSIVVGQYIGDTALAAVGTRMDGAIAAAFARVAKEASYSSRSEALLGLAERAQVNSITFFAASLVQAERAGSSLVDIIRMQAQSVRTERRLKVDDITNKLSTKMLFPMLLLMLPSIIMLMLAPMILQLGEFF